MTCALIRCALVVGVSSTVLTSVAFGDGMGAKISDSMSPRHDHLHGDNAHTDFYDYIISEFNSLDELLPYLASYLLIVAVVVRIGYWLATYREFLLSVSAAWALWFMYCVQAIPDDVDEKYSSFLEYLQDLSYTAKTLWDTFDTPTKVLIVLAVLFVYGLFKVYMKAREHKQTLKRVAYQASFAIVAPAVWYGSQYVLVGRMLPVTVGLMISVVPTFYSLRSFHASGGRRKHAEERGLWLSYWSCWPMVNYISAMIVHDTSQPSELQRLLLVLLVWLQFWEGSRHFPDLIMKAIVIHGVRLSHVARAGALYVGLPVWNIATANLPQWIRNPTAFFFQHFSRLSSAYEFAKGNKFVAGGGILMLAYVFWSFVSTLSGLLTVLIWWAASLKTTEVISKKKVDDYKGQLAFWILALGYTQIMMIPFVRYFAAIWEPIFLSVAQSMGESILTYLLKFVLGMYRGIVGPGARARSPVPAPTTTTTAELATKAAGDGSASRTKTDAGAVERDSSSLVEE